MRQKAHGRGGSDLLGDTELDEREKTWRRFSLFSMNSWNYSG